MFIMNKLYLLDKFKSCISSREISKFKSEITKKKIRSVCSDCSTFDIAKAGAKTIKCNNIRPIDNNA